MGFFQWLSDQAKQSEFGGDYKNVIALKTAQNDLDLQTRQQALENARKVAEYTELLKRSQARNYESLAQTRGVKTGLEVERQPLTLEKIEAQIGSLGAREAKDRSYVDAGVPESIVARNQGSAAASNARAANVGQPRPVDPTVQKLREIRLRALQRLEASGGTAPKVYSPSYYQELATKAVIQIHGQYADRTDSAILDEIQQYAQVLQQTDQDFAQRRLAGEAGPVAPAPRIPVKPTAPPAQTDPFAWLKPKPTTPSPPQVDPRVQGGQPDMSKAPPGGEFPTVGGQKVPYAQLPQSLKFKLWQNYLAQARR